MLTTEAKKEAIRKYKERKPARGIYVVECSATGRKWVGSSRNLDATRNGLWFTLRVGSHHDKPLQQEWNTQGEGTFEFRILECLEEDVAPLSIPDLLKEKATVWTAQLSARMLQPS
jgi:hypothetical protein